MSFEFSTRIHEINPQISVISSLYLLLLICLGCEINNNNSKHLTSDSPKVLQEKWSEKRLNLKDLIVLDTMNNEFCKIYETSKYFYIIYYFKGDCSVCIGEFVQWNNDLKNVTLNPKVSLVFINSSEESDLLEYYIEERELELEECLLQDTNSILQDTLEIVFEGELTNIFLVNKEGIILAYGNPFENENIANVYNEWNIFLNR